MTPFAGAKLLSLQNVYCSMLVHTQSKYVDETETKPRHRPTMRSMNQIFVNKMTFCVHRSLIYWPLSRD